MKLTRKWIIIITSVLAMVAVGCVAVLAFIGTHNDADTSNTVKVLTISDLDTPSVRIDDGTSDASVENLTKQLKAKIDEQIAAEQNPMSTVETLVGVLCNSANAKRPTQCADYITEFLNTRIDALKLESDEYGQPSDLQVTYWRAQLYADLVYSYQFIMSNKFTDSNGAPIDTSAEQLKYIDLYLKIAQDPANWGDPQTGAQDGRTWYYYEYKETDEFVRLRSQLKSGDT